MATLTTNYKLTKPSTTDAVSIAVINDNMDTIDAQLKNNANDISSIRSDLSSVASELSEHDNDTDIHITQSERTVWNSKTDDTTVNAHKSNTDIHITPSERTAWNAKTDDTAVNAHKSDKTVHITAAERSSWNSKTDDTVVNEHKSDTVSHITADERTKWDAMLPLAGGTMTGNLTVGSASIQTNGYVTGTWLRTTASIHLGSTPSDYPVLNGGWIYSRTKSEMKSDLGIKNITISTSDPSGGSSGDIWIKYS